VLTLSFSCLLRTHAASSQHARPVVVSKLVAVARLDTGKVLDRIFSLISDLDRQECVDCQPLRKSPCLKCLWFTNAMSAAYETLLPTALALLSKRASKCGARSPHSEDNCEHTQNAIVILQQGQLAVSHAPWKRAVAAHAHIALHIYRLCVGSGTAACFILLCH
jgi:hypothetical protein